MIKIKNVTIKNFLSVGNITQAINFEDSGLTLVLGNNLDLGGDGSRNGVGKAQPLYSKIHTPKGWTTMGDIKLHDVVSTPDGKNASVIGIFPQGMVDIYELTFEDGRKTHACGDHLWNVKSNSFDDPTEYMTLSTTEIMNLDVKNEMFIPLVDPIDDIFHVILPADPYSTGVLLGNNDLVYRTSPIGYNLIGPYKFASLSQRKALIQGLMDVNGFCDSKILRYSTYDKLLAHDLQFLIRSVGGIVNIDEVDGVNHLYIKHNDLQSLVTDPTLKDRLTNTDNTNGLKITDIKFIGKDKAQCIMINHPDHLYITDDFIVTHNTTMVNALSYALYGNAISNIKKNNLINKTNSKGMLVTVEFDINQTHYRIERGRSPNVLRFLVDGVNVEETDEGQGESRLTQLEIEKVVGMNHLMFKHLVALNTYNEPFLALRANDQREIIENLLGITMLSEKAVVLRELLKNTKDKIKEEEFRINGIKNANEQIEKSISDLKRRQRVWANKNNEEIELLTKSIDFLSKLDLEHELQQHIDLEEYNRKHAESAEIKKEIATLEASIQRESRLKEKALNDLNAAKEHTCYACGQDIHDEQHEQIMQTKAAAVADFDNLISQYNEATVELSSKLDNIVIQPSIPVTKYATAQEAYEQQSQLTSLQNQLESTMNAEDPYCDQIEILEQSGIQEIDWETMNELHNLREHQDFLLKLLTNKDSFVRKRIIEQNLQYLNLRLNYYLTKLGLPHEVIFQSDLSVEITELGRDLDFDNLSRGERNRLILGLSWAFRDVHECTNMPIDFMAIDELIDSGLDQNGVESALLVLKKMNRERNKNIFLISHREELVGRIHKILNVVKENGFTSFEISNTE